MPFEDVMGSVMQWKGATEALASLGARLAVLEPDGSAPPEVAAALEAVTEAAGLTDLDQIPPPQRAIALALIRTFLHQAVDLLDHPDREIGWRYSDPAILDGWGRASMMVPTLLAQAHPDLGEVTSFLDVGTGVGLLAMASTAVWPAATVVGIDTWDGSLDRARTHVKEAGLEDRITLRHQDLAGLDDVDVFDCAWVPSFFMSEAALEAGLPQVVRALRPGGWVVLARNRPETDPLTAALVALDHIRTGGSDVSPVRALELVEAAGCEEVHEVIPPGPAPIVLVLGRRPA